MANLPPFHVRRPRLTDLCSGERVVVVEAGAGYGKTVLGAELCDDWAVVAIEVALTSEVSADLLAARLRSAVERAGFSEAAQAMAASGDDCVAAVDDAIAALAGERAAFVIDDAHHADREAGALISHLAEHLHETEHLIVLARRLPDGAEKLRRGEYLQLAASDLALQEAETVALCQTGFGLAVTLEEAKDLDRATGGWTAAAVLAAARSRRTGEGISEVAAEAGAAPASRAVVAILDEALVALGPSERAALAQVARLPLVERECVDRAVGEGFFARCLAAGVPLVQGTDVWWDLPGPVRDHLATLAPVDFGVMEQVSADYVRRGRLSEALELLVASGNTMAAAATLARAEPAALDRFDIRELATTIDRLGESAVAAHPLILVHLARACGASTLMLRRSDLLDRAEALAATAADPTLDRAITVERAKDLVTNGHYAAAEHLALLVLSDTPDDELLTRAGALSAIGRAVCRKILPDGQRDEDAMRRSSDYLRQAYDAYIRLDMHAAAAIIIPYQAMWIDYARGDMASAMERIDAGLGLVVDRPRQWAHLMTFRAEIEIELGRYDDAEASLRESLRIADHLGDDQIHAYAYWDLMISASHRGLADATLEYARLTETNGAEWWEYAGPDFDAMAADDLDRVGHTTLAWQHLERALDDWKDAETLVRTAEAVLHARHGDPELAEEKLLTLPFHGLDEREHWRVILMRAWAAFRRGDRAAGGLAAHALEEASRIGLATLPLTKEREITEQLLGLAVATGQPAALALDSLTLPVSISLLGCFAILEGGRSVAVSPGQGAQVVKLLSVSGGRLPSERVIGTLWPDADPESGRNRLRTVLNRLRSEAGDVVVREGESLALGSTVRVDLDRFETDARRAIALGTSEPTLAMAMARAAIARYRGDVLPDDLYQEWAELPRERCRRTMLQLLDLCADVAASKGDLDEMRRVVELTIDYAPYEDERYLRAASVLLQQGRRGAALTVVQRAHHALAELGLEPSGHLLQLEESIVA